MLRDVDVQDASTIVADDEEAVEHAERRLLWRLSRPSVLC